jgi:monofunctional biosynthetic peptidoglycan transglycosylase
MRRWLRRGLAACGVLVLICVGYAVYTAATLPDVSPLVKTNPKVTALMEQRANERKARPRPLASWSGYGSISPHLRNAVIVSEDGNFFSHSGIDLHELREAIRQDWEEKRFARGASTITQQLAKNLYLSTSKNPLRKIRELFIARELERHLKKQRILEIYLNVIEWGDNVYGIGPAAQRYFGKSPGTLLPEQAAVLAAMIPSPRSYSPGRGITRYLDGRKVVLLNRMTGYGYLSAEDRDAALARPVSFQTAP